MKTSELMGPALNWAVAKCEYVGEPPFVIWNKSVWQPDEGYQYTPSTDWAQGGAVIEREKISVLLSFQGSYAEGANAKPTGWCARKYQYGVLAEPLSYGPTPLIAAMRCYVASKLGDEIEIPEELK